jgi:C-terminal processing protease CtpA/Prc
LNIRVLEGTPHVYRDLSAEQRGLAEQLIRSINGVASEQIVKTMLDAALILDVRDNGGGEDALGKDLLSYLINEPFKYYDDLVINALDFSFRQHSDVKEPLPAAFLARQPNGKYIAVKHPNWGTHQPSRPGFRGPVYILINGKSFSTTSKFLSHVHFHKRATFIGEESGGGYYGNSSGFMPVLVLPNTKVRLSVPLMTYYLSVIGNPSASRGIIPDHEVKYAIRELLSGTHKQMELALKLARKQ